MPNTPGADARQSRTLQSLNRFTPDGINALAGANPYFAPAGRPAQFFSVSDDITTDSALEGASMFLATAVSLGNTPEALDDDARRAIVHLAEMAKALVDSIVSSSMAAPRGAVQADPENPARPRAPRPMHVEEAIGYFLACGKAFASLEVILGEIDGSDNLLAQGSLISTGLGIAERYADLAERWRDDLKAGGLQS